MIVRFLFAISFSLGVMCAASAHAAVMHYGFCYAQDPVGALFSSSGVGSGITVSSGGQVASSAAGGLRSAKLDVTLTSGKHYFEWYRATGTNNYFGFAVPGSYDGSTFAGNYAGSFGYGPHGPTRWQNGTQDSNYGSAVSSGSHIFGVAVDLSAGKVWYSVDGAWIGGNPVAGTSPAFTFTPGSWLPVASFGASTAVTITDPLGLLYAPPEGYEGGWFAEPDITCPELPDSIDGDRLRFLLACVNFSLVLFVGLGAAGGLAFVAGWS